MATRYIEVVDPSSGQTIDEVVTALANAVGGNQVPLVYDHDSGQLFSYDRINALVTSLLPVYSGYASIVAPDGVAAQFDLMADDADDAPDVWTFLAQLDGTLQIGHSENLTGGYLELSLATAASAILKVVAAEGRPAEIQLWADEGDDVTDKWSIVSDTDNGLYFKNNGNNRFNVDSNGNMSVQGTIQSVGTSNPIGYADGAGGAVTQDTSITTTVVLSKPVGVITTFTNPTINAAAEASFTVTNTAVTAKDTIVVNVKTQFSDGFVIAFVSAVADGSFVITLSNVGAANVTAGTAIINFAVINGANS